MNCTHAQERVVDTMWGMALARLVDSCKLFFDFRLLSAFDSFWRAKTNEMVTFVAKNSGGVTKKPMIILKEFFFFVLVSTSGARIHTEITEQPSFFIKL